MNWSRCFSFHFLLFLFHHLFGLKNDLYHRRAVCSHFSFSYSFHPFLSSTLVGLMLLLPAGTIKTSPAPGHRAVSLARRSSPDLGVLPTPPVNGFQSTSIRPVPAPRLQASPSLGLGSYQRPPRPLQVGAAARLPPIGQEFSEASATSQSVPTMSPHGLDEEYVEYNGGEDEYVSMGTPAGGPDPLFNEPAPPPFKPPANSPPFSIDDDYTDMSQMREQMRKTSIQSDQSLSSSRRSSQVSGIGESVEQGAGFLSHQAGNSPVAQRQDELSALKDDLSRLPRRTRRGRDSLGQLVVRERHSSDVSTDTTASSNDAFYVNVAQPPAVPDKAPPIPAKRRHTNQSLQTKSSSSATESQGDQASPPNYTNILQGPPVDDMPRSGSAPSLSHFTEGFAQQTQGTYQNMPAADSPSTQQRRELHPHPLRDDPSVAAQPSPGYNRLHWDRQDSADSIASMETPPLMRVDYSDSSRGARPIGPEDNSDDNENGYSHLEDIPARKADNPPQKPPRRNSADKQSNLDDLQLFRKPSSTSEEVRYSTLETPSPDQPLYAEMDDDDDDERYTDLPRRVLDNNDDTYALATLRGPREPPDGQHSPKSPPRPNRAAKPLPVVESGASDTSNPFIIAQEINERLPDLRVADIVVALKEYGDRALTERHLKAQLVLDLYNLMREMNMETPLTRCEAVLKEFRWQQQQAVNFFLSPGGAHTAGQESR